MPGELRTARPTFRRLDEDDAPTIRAVENVGGAYIFQRRVASSRRGAKKLCQENHLILPVLARFARLWIAFEKNPARKALRAKRPLEGAESPSFGIVDGSSEKTLYEKREKIRRYPRGRRCYRRVGHP